MAAPTTEAVPTSVKEEADVSMKDVAELDSDQSEKNRARKQIEFYFADANLPYDKFMWTLHTSNAEHWVPISTVASFKRMSDFKSKGFPWIVEALESSTELEVDSETKTKVRRRTEVKEPTGQFERSIYAKGFGEETPTLQKELENLFIQYGVINAVRMRRDENKKFKGSVFVEFSDLKTVNAFLNADPKPSWKGEPLLVMSKDAYCEMKIKEKGLTGKSAQLRRNNLRKPGGFNGLELQKGGSKPAAPSTSKKEVYLQFWGKTIRVYEDGKVKEEDIPEYIDGATLKWQFSEGEAPDSVSYRDIKGPLKEKFGRPPFIKYEKGSAVGYLAFDKKLSDEELTFVKDTLGKLGGKDVKWDVAPSEESKSAHVERIQTAAQSIAASSATLESTNNRISLVSGSTLKFDLEAKEGEDENVRFAELKLPLKEHFKHPPFIQYERGNSYGFMAFDEALSEEQIKKVEDSLKTIGGRNVNWSKASDEEAQNVHEDRLRNLARMSANTSSSNSNGRGGGGNRGRGRGRGGGGGGRGGRGGGRGGGRSKGGERNGDGVTASTADETAGDKRKRAVEPDGGPDVGVRGAGTGAPPSIKKAKVEDA